MTLVEILTDYGRFRAIRAGHGDKKIPEMRLESVRVLSVSVEADPFGPEAGAAELERQIADFAPDRGWVCYQSEVATVQDGQLPRSDSKRGLLLSGELVNLANESLHIRQDGQGGWVVTRFIPDQGEEYLVDDYSLIVHERDPERRANPGRAYYRRYWRPDPQHGIRQAAARFIGFDEGR